MKKIANFLNRNKHIILMTLSFLILDIVLRYFTKSINFYKIHYLVPNLFTIGWIFLTLSFCLSLKSKYGKSIYIIAISISLLLFLTHSIYYSYFKTFFDFSVLKYAGEGGEYLIDAIKSSPIWVFITTFITITLAYFGVKFYPKKEKNSFKYLMVLIPVFALIHTITPLFLGEKVSTWDAWRKPRNVYIAFNDNNRSMQVAGFYEYNIRNLYVNFIKEKENIDSGEKKVLDEKFSENIEYSNEYTGLFKDKNVIFVQLESIDSFLVTKEIMPTLYSLRNNSINFNNHYSFTSGAGSTFNSEYMVNTGYTTPITVNDSAYTYNKNNYDYSLANLLKKAGYTVNAFHMNTPEYYSRNVNYKAFGYDSFNSLKSMDNGKYYKDNTYWLDTELIKNENFNKLIFNTEQKFADYIITYSAHMPFQIDKGVCNLLVEDKTTPLSEYECLKLQAKETDDMLKLLIENLEEKGLIDNTVLVLYADHYLYTLNDKTLLDKYKITENNLINNTTWMVWSNGMQRKDISKVTSQLNILPTMLNLLGLEYHPNYYLMNDAFDKNYKGLVFFNDYSWYDGNVYVENNKVTNGKSIDEEELNEKNELVNKLVKINDAVITTDYFKTLKKAHHP
ncbi:MAG: sulfatase-like hydrolase/transferase [Bacilli bacterium]